MMNGLIRPGPPFMQRACAAPRTRCSPPMPLPMMHAAAERVFLGEVEPAVARRPRRRRPAANWREAVEPAGRPGVDDRLGVEVLDLAAEVDLEVGGVEQRDGRDAALARRGALASSPARSAPSGLTVPSPVMTTGGGSWSGHCGFLFLIAVSM